MQCHTSTTPLRPRTSTTVASWLGKVLDGATEQLPQLSRLAARIYEQGSPRAGRLERGLNALHDCMAAVEAAPHARQMRVCTDLLADDADTFRRSSEAAEAQLRPLLLEFLQESLSLENAVERCAGWLAEIDTAPDEAEADAGAEALPPLAERLKECRARLALLQAINRSAHQFHAAALQVANTRPALGACVRDQVQRACTALETHLEQSRQAPPAPRAAAAALASARGDAQIWVAQALSLVLRLHGAQHSLAREAAALRHRCGLAVPGAQELETVSQDAEVALH